MDIVILVLCVLIAALLVVLIAKTGKSGGNAEEIKELKSRIDILSANTDAQNKLLINQSAAQGEVAVKQISALGDSLRDEQSRQQSKTAELLSKTDEKMDRLIKENSESLDKIRRETLEALENMRRSNTESFDKINAEVSEKFTKNLDEKITSFLETVSRRLSELNSSMSELIKDNRASLDKLRHETLETLENMRRSNAESLDKINGTVNEKLQKTLDDKISKSFETVNKRLAEVYEGLGEMKNVASGVSDLKNVLSNVKTRGIMGEIQLSAILNEILAPEQFCEQAAVKPGSSEKVDFAVKLPGMEEGECVYLPIDSKFPGDTYSNLLDAYDSGSSEELKAKRKLLEAEMKRCAKSIHDKYIVPPYTTDFAIMFLPFEGLYAEVVNMGLVEILQRDYKINIAGPSTMAAMLNSLQMGFRTLAIQKKSGEVWKILEGAKKEFASFEKVLESARNRLKQADDDLEKLIGTRTRAINRRLSTVSALDSSEEAEKLLEIN